MTQRLLPAALVLVLCSGCALLRPGQDAATPAPPLPPPVALVVQAPAELKGLLETHLDLARLRRVAPGEEISEPELRRLEAATPLQARALLETEGYFAPTVTLQREPGDPPQVRVLVEPGPRAQVEQFELALQGDLRRAVDAGDPQALALRASLEQGWPLPPGADFRNPAWATAKNTALARLRAAGYAAATLSSSAAEVDAQTHRVRLSLGADSGPLFRVGELRIRGLDRQDPQTVRHLADFEPGAPATEALLLDFQERLQRSGLYDSVSVTLDTDVATAPAAPVTVRLREQALQQATVGIGISANTGERATLEHLHRRVFGQRATARNKFELGRLRQAWEGEIASHAQPGLYRNLVGGAIEKVESDVDTVSALRLRLGRTQDTPSIERLAFVQLERATVRTDTTREQGDAVSINYHGIWRDVDSVLLPTDGMSLALQGGTGLARSSTGPDGPFVRLYGRFYLWRPIGESWFGQARVELGQVFVRNDVRVPDTQRFRAGGDDSVRGYAYRTLGPRVGAEVESGNVLFTASAEIARPVSPRLPSVWWAAFVDVGNAATRWDDLSPVWGVGVGARWRSPVGPLRVDLAYGEEIQKWRMHLSVGIAF